MKYIISIEGGGTKSKAVIQDKDDKFTLEINGSATNPNSVGFDLSVKNLLKNIFDCTVKAGADKNDIAVIVIGTAGGGNPVASEQIRKTISVSLSDKTKISVTSDAAISLEGAFAGKPGIIVIAGTGSSVFGKDSDNNVYYAGGYGRLIGDEGSGFSIARRGLNLISKYFDGLTGNSQFILMAKNLLGITDRDKLTEFVYSKTADIASLTPLILKAAENDTASKNILTEESELLARQVESVCNKINPEFHQIVFTGSLIENENIYSDLLKKMIIELIPTVKFVRPQFTPVEGGILIAKKIINSGNAKD